MDNQVSLSSRLCVTGFSTMFWLMVWSNMIN